jgi:hypothetical protein
MSLRWTKNKGFFGMEGKVRPNQLERLAQQGLALFLLA